MAFLFDLFGSSNERPMPQFSDKHVIKWENSGNCDYFSQCEEFFETIGIDKKYLNGKKNFCFCDKCRLKDKKPNCVVFKRGEPPANYVLPVGWSRFGIIPACTENELAEYYKTGHIAYHGSYVSSIKKIVICGKLKFPGEKTHDGTVIKIRDNHIRDRVKLSGSSYELPVDTGIFMSPSIKYSSYKNVYAVDKKYTLSKKFDEKEKIFKCALELRILPNKYRKHRETVLSKKQRDDKVVIDEHVPNDEIEWNTEDKNVHIVTGVMVQCREE